MNGAEQALLGAALFAPRKALECGVQPTDFSDNVAAAVWSCVLRMTAAGREVDLVTVIEELGERYRKVVAEAASGTFAVANIDGYARSVRKEAKRRQLRAFLDGLDTAGDPDEVIGEALGGLIEMSRSETVREYDMRQLMHVVTDEIQAAWEAAEQGRTVGVPTGFGDLDALLGGLHPTDLIVVAGRPAMGKTAWALSAAMNAARKGHKVGFVSAEMAAAQLGNRLAAGVSGVPAHKLRNGRMVKHEFDDLTKAMSAIAELPIRVVDPDRCKPSDVLRQAFAWRAAGMELLVVDYLQRLDPDERNDSRVREVGELTKAMKSVAKAANVPVVLLAQLSRKCEERKDKRPVMADLRDSGEIEQEADQILFLYRDCVYHSNSPAHEAEILIGKNRHGPIGDVPMAYLEERLMWCDPDMRGVV